MAQSKRSALPALIGAGLLALGLGGCADTVELNGGIFDAMGISAAAQAKQREEVQLRDRAGLVMPPQLDRLPPPGSGFETIASRGDAWPTDPDQTAEQKDAELRRQQEEICEKDELARRSTGQRDAPPAVGPLGTCGPSIVRAMTGQSLYYPGQQQSQ